MQHFVFVSLTTCSSRGVWAVLVQICYESSCWSRFWPCICAKTPAFCRSYFTDSYCSQPVAPDLRDAVWTLPTNVSKIVIFLSQNICMRVRKVSQNNKLLKLFFLLELKMQGVPILHKPLLRQLLSDARKAWYSCELHNIFANFLTKKGQEKILGFWLMNKS